MMTLRETLLTRCAEILARLELPVTPDVVGEMTADYYQIRGELVSTIAEIREENA